MATAPAFAQVTAGANLGCATSEPLTTAAAEQPFERGAILQRADGSTYLLTIFNHARGQWQASGQ